jgi:hypothetical protein
MCYPAQTLDTKTKAGDMLKLVSPNYHLFRIVWHTYKKNGIDYPTENQKHPTENSYFCFGVTKQLKYTIEGVSRILVPLDQTHFPRLRLGK